jgi:hypothetical protein
VVRSDPERVLVSLGAAVDEEHLGSGGCAKLTRRAAHVYCRVVWNRQLCARRVSAAG